MNKLLHLSGILAIIVCSDIFTSCSTGNLAYDPDAQQVVIGDDIAITSTQYGKVKGYICRDIYTFLGIPYGANTAGENRFMPPQPPKPWDGVKPTVYFGNSSPQREPIFNPQVYSTWQDHWNYSNLSEDCLRLNVWIPGWMKLNVR